MIKQEINLLMWVLTIEENNADACGLYAVESVISLVAMSKICQLP